MNDKSCFIVIHCITLSKLEKAYSLEFIRIIISTLFKTINVLIIITEDYIPWKWYPKDLRIDYLLNIIIVVLYNAIQLSALNM